MAFSKTQSFVRGRSWLFSIAINDYQDFTRLYNPVKDASDILSILQDDYDFEAENVISLVNETATGERILDTFEKLVLEVQPEDSLLVYFAGHGHYSKRTEIGYLLPIDAKRDRISSFIPHSDIVNYIRAIHSRHTFLVMDSCFSGSFFASNRSIEDGTEKFADTVERFPSRWGLAAGRIEEVADGQRGDNSPFAKSIISFLSNNRLERFPISDLVQYVKRITALNSDQTPIGGPIQKVDDMGGEFVFVRKAGIAPQVVIQESTNPEPERKPEPVRGVLEYENPQPVQVHEDPDDEIRDQSEYWSTAQILEKAEECFRNGEVKLALEFMDVAAGKGQKGSRFRRRRSNLQKLVDARNILDNPSSDFGDIQVALRHIQSVKFNINAKKVPWMDRWMAEGKRKRVMARLSLEEVGEEQEGMMPAKLNGKWGFADDSGTKLLISPIYDEVKEFNNGWVEVRLGKEWFQIDKKGLRKD